MSVRGSAWLGFVPVICGVITLLLLVVTIHRGFDFTDEGYGLLAVRWPGRGDVLSFYGYVLSAIETPFGFGIVTGRWTAIFLDIAGAALLSAGTLCWLPRVDNAPRLRWFTVIGFVTLGVLSAYGGTVVNTASYNVLTAFGINLAIGGILLATGAWDRIAGLSFFALSAAVLGLVLAFAGKPSSGAALILLFAVCIVPLIREGKFALAFAGIAFGFIIGAGILLFCIPDVMDAFRSLFITLRELSRAPGYNTRSDVIQIIVWGFASFVIALCTLPFAFLYYCAANNILAKRIFVLIHGFVAVGSFLVACVILKYWPFHFAFGFHVSFENFRPSVAAVFAITLVAAVWITGLFREKKVPALRQIALATLLLASPYTGAIGSNGGMFLPAYQYMGPWFVFLLLFCQAPFAELGEKFGLRLYSLLAVVVVLQVIENHVFYPYRVPSTLFGQDMPITGVPLARGVLVDASAKSAVEDAYAILHQRTDFKEGDIVLTSFGMPGMTYLLGGTSPGWSWYATDWIDVGCDVLQSENVDLHGAFILVNATPEESFATCLRTRGANYPNDYELAGSFQLSNRGPFGDLDVQILAPRDRLR